MKTHLLFLATLLVSFSLLAQEGQFAPLNPDFVRYQANIKELTNLKSADMNKFGYAPSPLQLNFENYKGVSSMQTSKTISGALPSRYDLRDLGFVTSVKSQGALNCWAYSVMASIESNWLLNHWGSYDLSEQNISACNGINSKYNEGGDGNISSAYLTRFSGPLLETDDPNKPPANNNELNANICKNIQARPPRYVLSSKFLPPDIELIKRTIMTSGGVHISMKWYIESENYNWKDYTFFYSGNSVVWEHGVLLVGWDDNKEVTGGSKSPKGTKGAWIVKNSWGASFGEKGYFYLSYYDKGALSQVCYFDESADTTEIDQLNMYDDLGASRSFGFGKEVAYGLTKFTAPAKAIIKKIGTYVISACSSVDIEIYKAFADGKLSGLLYSKKNINCEFPGQRVFDVMAIVDGEYYVKIKYNTPACHYPLPVESFIKDGWFLAPDIKQPGTNWISTDGEKWENIGAGVEGKEMDLTIRSYTISADKPYGFFDLYQKQLCICDSLSICAELSDPGIDCKWQFLPDGIPATYSGTVPPKVKFASTGMKEIQLIMSSSKGNNKLSRSLEVVNSLDVEIYSSFENTMGYLYGGRKIPYPAAGEIGKPLFLSVNIEADSFKWNAPYDTLNASGIYVTPKNIGPNSYNVTTIRGTCRGSDTILVEGYIRPVNDNISSALELKEGISAPFTNFWATVEANEPTPPFMDCGTTGRSTEGFWCPDGGLQNSVWFWFTTQNDSVKIFTDGIYSQIAVYDGENPDDLKNTKYKILAASDDYYSIHIRYEKKITLTNLVVGKKYWVQFDGGIGGSNEIFKMGIHYPKYFSSSADTLFLESNSSKTNPSNLIVQADSSWTVGRIPNSTWFDFTPNKGLGKETISIYSKTKNTGIAQRIGGITLRSPLYETKNIVIIQLPFTGVDLNLTPEFILYPNPAKEFIVFDWLNDSGSATVEIYDLLGKIIIQQKLTESKQVFVGNLPNGLYAYRIYNGEKYYTGKVIKE